MTVGLLKNVYCGVRENRIAGRHVEAQRGATNEQSPTGSLTTLSTTKRPTAIPTTLVM